jgi:hypothetical protein
VDQDEDRLPKFEGHALRGGLEPKFEGHALRGDLELLSELHVVCRLALVHTGELQVLLQVLALNLVLVLVQKQRTFLTKRLIPLDKLFYSYFLLFGVIQHITFHTAESHNTMISLMKTSLKIR